MEQALSRITRPDLTPDQLQMILAADVPEAYRQLWQVASVQVTWKHGWWDEAQLLADATADPSLRALGIR